MSNILDLIESEDDDGFLIDPQSIIPEKKEPKGNFFDAVIAGAGQGASLYLGDEGAAVLGALFDDEKIRTEPLTSADRILEYAKRKGIPLTQAQDELNELGQRDATFWERYDRALGRARKVDTEAKDGYEGVATAAELAGGFLIPAGMLFKGAKAGATLGQKVAKTAIEGAALGAIAGAGHAEEDRLEGAVMGAGIGALGGAGIRAALSGLGALRTAGSNALTTAARKGMERMDVDKAVGEILEKPNPSFDMFKQLALDDTNFIFSPAKMRKVKADKMAPWTKPSQQIKKKAANKDIAKLARKVRQQGTKEQIDQLSKQLLAGKILDSKALGRRLQKHLGVKNPLELDAKIVRQGRNALEEDIDRWRRTEIAVNVAKEQVKTKVSRELNWAVRAFTFFSDGKPVQKWIDNMLGTDLSRIINTMDKRTTLVATASEELVQKFKSLKAKGLVPAGRTEKLSPEFQEFMEEARQMFNSPEIGLNLGKYDGKYIPKVFKGAKEIYSDILAIHKEMGGNYLIKKSEWKAALKNNKELDEFVESMKMLTGRKHIKSGQQLELAVDSYLHRPSDYKAVTNTIAKSALARHDKMPKLLVEQDPTKAVMKYISNTARHASYGKGLKEIRYVRDVAKAAASKATDDKVHKHVVEYLDNLMADITGTRTSGNVFFKVGRETVEQFEKSMLRKAGEATTDRKRELYEIAADIPDMLRSFNALVYPNFIGLNPRSMLQNMSSPYFQNLGMMGGRYTTALFGEAMLDLGKLMAKGPRAIDDFVESKGYVESKFRGEIHEILKDSMAKSATVKGVEKVINKWADLSMWGFSKSEKIARAMNHFMAERAAKDLQKAFRGVKGFRGKAAKKFLDDITDPAYRKAISKAANGGKWDDVEYLTAEYLNAESMFNYTRANMSEFGRVMGPIFSVFTKWPSTMWGRIFQQLQDEGKVDGGSRLLRMFLYPLMTAQLADSATYEMKDSPRYKKLIGQGGVKGWTPGSNLLAWTSGEFLSPPLIQTVGGLTQAIPNLDDLIDEPEKALVDSAAQIEKAFSGYTPGYNLWPTLTQRIPGILLDEEPTAAKTITRELFGD